MGLAKVGAMEDPQATPVQILVFSALIVAVDPVAVSLSTCIMESCLAFKTCKIYFIPQYVGVGVDYTGIALSSSSICLDINLHQVRSKILF